MDNSRISKKMGLNWNYSGPDEVYDELKMYGFYEKYNMGKIGKRWCCDISM